MNPGAGFVEKEKERQRFARSRVGQPRAAPDRMQLLAQTADDDTLAKMAARMGRPTEEIAQYYAIGDPCLPCVKPLKDLKVIQLSDLKQETHHYDQAIIVRRTGK